MQEQKLITRMESGLFPLLDLPSSTVANETAFVICSGESLTKEDVKLVEIAQAKNLCSVIAVNNAFQLAQNADIAYARDSCWWNKYYKEISEHTLPVRNAIGMRAPHNPNMPRLTYIPTAERNGGIWCEQTNMLPCYGRGTGSSAILLSAKLKATKIITLGMDMKGTHFFGTYRNGLVNTSRYKFMSMLHNLNEIYSKLSSLGFTVLDATRDGAPRDIPHVKLETVLSDLQNGTIP